MSRRLPLFVVFLALLGSAFAASASGAARFYTPSYGWNDPAEPEVVGGFDLGADGSLAPIPGSPFPGEEPFREGGLWSLAFNPDGTRAVSGFYFNGGVQAYRVPASGIFELAGATSTASATSVAITPDGRFAYASTRNFNTPAEGIRRFAVNADGSLTPLSPAGGSGEYNDLAITPDGRFLFAATGNQVERFAIALDGSLDSLGTTPAVGARSLAMAPDGRFLFARFSGGSSGGVISFAVAADGGLQQAGDPASIPDSFVRLFAVAPDGRHLYLADSNQNTIHVIGIASDGTPGLIGGMSVERPESVGVSPDGRFLVYYRGGGSDDALGVASIGPDGVPTALGRELPWDTGEPERIVFQPHPAPVASFTVRAGAPGLVTQFDAGASARAAGYEWDFGDGTKLANGGLTQTHVYAKAGVYPVTLTVTDGSGCSTRQIYNGQTTLCPGGSAPVATGTVDTLPLLGKLKAKPKKFHAKPKGKAKGKFGTTFRYTLSEPATVRFKFERKVRLPIKCIPRAKVRCPRRFRFALLSSRTQKAKAGASKLKWNGRRNGKPLPPGSYRATVVATDKAGGRSAAKTVGFRILLPQEP